MKNRSCQKPVNLEMEDHRLSPQVYSLPLETPRITSGVSLTIGFASLVRRLWWRTSRSRLWNACQFDIENRVTCFSWVYSELGLASVARPEPIHTHFATRSSRRIEIASRQTFGLVRFGIVRICHGRIGIQTYVRFFERCIVEIRCGWFVGFCRFLVSDLIVFFARSFCNRRSLRLRYAAVEEDVFERPSAKSRLGHLEYSDRELENL